MPGRNPYSNGLNLAAITVVALLAASLFVPRATQAQTFTVIHSFAGQPDGSDPELAGVTPDGHGNLYGSNTGNAADGNGEVFMLSPKNSSWTLSTLYNFPGSEDTGGIIRDPQGRIYGATDRGGAFGGGTVFELLPWAIAAPSLNPEWNAITLYTFTGLSDGGEPHDALAFDQAGNLYGTTTDGGSNYLGTVFQLKNTNGTWTENVIHTFNGGQDGQSPYSSVVVDRSGNVYGTTPFGGAYGCGAVYELTPSGSGWTKNTLYSFQGNGDGCNPAAGVILDSAGNLYGSTAFTDAGNVGYGTVFELSPADQGWSYTLIQTFSTGGQGRCNGAPQFGSGPFGSMVMDSAGNLYGATAGDGAYGQNGTGYGNVFKLTPSDGGWIYTSLHDFTNGDDGGTPCGWLSVDAKGDVFGTTRYGGTINMGTVWEVTP